MAITHFVLSEDRSQARYLRRALAEKQARLHLIVGTWPELVSQLTLNFLFDQPEDLWTDRFRAQTEEMENVFWQSSFEVAAEETLDSVGRELRRLIIAAGPGNHLEKFNANEINPRAARHFNDLALLHKNMEHILPTDLAKIELLLSAETKQALKKIVVYTSPVYRHFNPWQKALLNWIEEWTSDDKDQALEETLRSVALKTNNLPSSSLHHLCSQIFSNEGAQQPKDDSVQWLAVRDPLQEAEVAAGIVQKAMADDPGLSFSDIAILIPGGLGYVDHVHSTFSMAGIPLSGLNCRKPLRDLGHEVVFYFLYAMRKPAPLMALTTFLTSPLLPWKMKQGHKMAQLLMDRKFKLSPPVGADSSVKELFSVLQQGAEKVADLKTALAILSKCLITTTGIEIHIKNAKDKIEDLISILDKSNEIAWDELLRVSSPLFIEGDQPVEISIEGVAVFTESEEPWRYVRKLIVLGFKEGHYPEHAINSPVFCETDLQDLRDRLNLQVEIGSDIVERQRQRFKRHLSCVKETAHFLTPRKDEIGEALQISETMTFIEQLFHDEKSPESLVLELERTSDRDRSFGLSLADQALPVKPRSLTVSDLKFKRDLLSINTLNDGSIYPLSPSRIEVLMTSPLAWLFKAKDLLPKDWVPDSLDVSTKGTLAHRVLEILFRPGADLPSSETIEKNMTNLVNQAIIEIAPFLLAPEWRVERLHLQKEVETAAIRWRDFITDIGGKILGNEVWLKGMLDKIPIHGSADTLLKLPDGTILVVDFKKSKSSLRRQRMETGYDSQASLYRIMLQTGDAIERNEELTQALEENREIGVLYYLLNDQVVLSDTDGRIRNDIPGVFELGKGISIEAMNLIRERIAEIKKGEVRLNNMGDKMWYERNAGIKIYALEDSPLLRLFMHPVEVAI